MTITDQQLSMTGRQAAQKRDWKTVEQCANELLRRSPESHEGLFLFGLLEKISNHPVRACETFEKLLALAPNRYDAAIELASQYVISLRNSEAIALLEKYSSYLGNSPRYLDMAGTIYTDIGLSAKAWPLYKKACELQPEIDLFQANLAACAVFVGELVDAKSTYRSLLNKNPSHQRNHYQLSRLEKVKDAGHVNEMQKVLAAAPKENSRNVFINYALGKELEDLSRWDEAFKHYQLAGDGVSDVSNYSVEEDEAFIDNIMDVCSEKWLSTVSNEAAQVTSDKTPIFIVGLPRTGTTLTDRILSSHSEIESIGETQYLESVLRMQSGVPSISKLTTEMVTALGSKDDLREVAGAYIKAVSYLHQDKPYFVEKLPYNFLYLGFILKAFPKAKFVYLSRNAMDSCFAIYKQPFTWAYKYSYRLSDLGRYYIAHHKMLNHWRGIMGNRLVEVEYEALVQDQEVQTRQMLDSLGFEFEAACLDFNNNTTATTTASSIQVREKIHSRSVLRWKEFEKELSPLAEQLRGAGISV